MSRPATASERSMIAQLTLRGLVEPRIESPPRLLPFLKWPGGKSDELSVITAAAPALTGRFIDPFVGGGSVLLATPIEVPAWANDACADLVRLYTAAGASDALARGDKALTAGQRKLRRRATALVISVVAAHATAG